MEQKRVQKGAAGGESESRGGKEGRERGRDRKGEWWGPRRRGQCKTLKKLSVVRNGASACYELN